MELLHQGIDFSVWIDVRAEPTCPFPLEAPSICQKCGRTMRWWTCGGYWYCMCDVLEGGS